MRVDTYPSTRAPRQERPPIITKRGKRIISHSGPCTELVRRARNGEKGGIPEMVPAAFVHDVTQWALIWAHSQYGWTQDRGPVNFQEDMADHWPAAWMLYVFGTIGYLDYQTEYED